MGQNLPELKARIERAMKTLVGLGITDTTKVIFARLQVELRAVEEKLGAGDDIENAMKQFSEAA